MNSIVRLMFIFFKIGLFAFGGGYTMIPMIKSELIAAGFMTAEEVADVVAISQITPGPFAINAATFAGVRTAGILGGVAATIAVILPAFILALFIGNLILKNKNNRFIGASIRGLKPATTALILSAAVTFIAPVIFGVSSIAGLALGTLISTIDIWSLVIAVLSGTAIIGFKAPVIPTILASAAMGILVFAVL